MTCPVSSKLSAQQKKECCKEKLSYKNVGEKVYPWVQCQDPKVGVFCALCKKWGRPPPSARGVRTTMAKHVEQQNVIEMQCAGAAKQAKRKRKRIVRLF